MTTTQSSTITVGLSPLGYAIGTVELPRTPSSVTSSYTTEELRSRVPYPQTPETASAWIKAHGITVTAIARHHQLPRLVLVDLLRKRLVGNYGQAHEAAIVLGLKPTPDRLAA